MAKARRQLVVDRSVQYGYAARLMLRWTLLLAVVGSCVVLAQYFMSVTSDVDEAILSMQTSACSFLIIFVLLIPVLTWDAVKMSHRFVGPIVKMKAVVRGIAEGKYQVVKLRKGDYWHDLADELNQLQEQLQARELSLVKLASNRDFQEKELAVCGD